jgi:hypothetical protein
MITSAAEPADGSTASSSSGAFPTCVVYLLGYPGMGKRTVGGHLAGLVDGVLVDNALLNRPLLELFRWDGIQPLPPQIWEYAVPIRDAVLDAIEDLAPPSNSYVFTNVIEAGPTAATAYERVRSVAVRRGSLFLAVMLTCDIDVQVGRIANPDRVALRKGIGSGGLPGSPPHHHAVPAPGDRGPPPRHHAHTGGRQRRADPRRADRSRVRTRTLSGPSSTPASAGEVTIGPVTWCVSALRPMLSHALPALGAATVLLVATSRLVRGVRCRRVGSAGPSAGEGQLRRPPAGAQSGGRAARAPAGRVG